LGPGDLARAISELDIERHPNLIVGLDRPDDAGVYKLSDDTALVQTLDFLTPIVDDPYVFGQIAAANALSDVYAMGGKPLTAMNIVGFPSDTMDMGVLTDILRGGLDKMKEAHVALVGGHSVKDEALKYGLSVTGIVDPRKVWSNGHGMAGDALVLTKPLGTGIVGTAIKRGSASEESARRAEESMCQLNRVAAEIGVTFPVHACTDVTGFGLLGHGAEMIEGTGLGLVVDSSRLPILPGVREYAEKGLLPGGLHRNRKYREASVEVRGQVPQYLLDGMWDPQTSGGLLLAIPADHSLRFIEQLEAHHIVGRTIGTIIKSAEEKIIID
jgi:selenide,water dikinase